MFQFQSFPPSPPLREFVFCYLVSDVIDNNDLSTKHEALPMGITTLCFSDIPGCYANRISSEGKFVKAPEIAIVGQMSQKGESIFYRPFRSVVTLFYTTTLYQFWGMPMHTVAGHYSMDATDVFPSAELRACRERMFQSNDPARAVKVLDTFLLNKRNAARNNVRNIDKLAGVIQQRAGNVNLDWLTRQANMSVKTLERHFNEKIGLMPKYFSRIIRFKNAFQQLEQQGRSADVMKVVEACGYTDQAHLIKEFKNFTERTPTFYNDTEEVLSSFFLQSVSK